MSMSSPITYRDIIDQHRVEYDALIQSGRFEPFVYPWGTFGAAGVILYLLIPHAKSPILRRARFLAWGFITSFAIYTIRYCRARSFSPGFSVGLTSAWSILWCANILVVHDCQTDFMRIERTEGGISRVFCRGKPATKADGAVKEHDPVPKLQDGTAPEVTHLGKPQTPLSASALGTEAAPPQRTGRLAWQPYPLRPFIERLDWVADVFCNFRGMGWNWQITGLPPPPLAVQKQLQATSGTSISSKRSNTSSSGVNSYHTRSSLLRANLRILVFGYLGLDLLKTIMMKDPYFWGLTTHGAPPHLPLLVQHSPILLRTYRLLISQAAAYSSLNTLFSLAPLFFAGVLGPRVLGVRGEPWMYPDSYGSYRNVLDKGLAGWWGGWWHQTFRFAFEAPAKRVVRVLGLDEKGMGARALQLGVAFALSGSVHACGSYTMMGDTRPLRGPFAFFVLQAGGIMLQTAAVGLLKKAGVAERTPRLVRQLANFVYVHVWFYYTAPLLCDDFAKGRLWLYEPIPISLFRGMGFGVEGDGWWHWGGRWAWWHWGKHWWQSGLAL